MDGPVELPDKLFFKIGEVARIVGVEPYVLRYWETEFRNVRPRKTRGGQRMYSRGDVETFLRIKGLLRDEGFTIAGARKRLGAGRAARAEPGGGPEAVAADEGTARLVVEIARLETELQTLGRARAEASRRAAAREDALRGLRKEITGLLEAIDRLRARV